MTRLPILAGGVGGRVVGAVGTQGGEWGGHRAAAAAAAVVCVCVCVWGGGGARRLASAAVRPAPWLVAATASLMVLGCGGAAVVVVRVAPAWLIYLVSVMIHHGD
jgi:hypothetical protein